MNESSRRGTWMGLGLLGALLWGAGVEAGCSLNPEGEKANEAGPTSSGGSSSSSGMGGGSASSSSSGGGSSGSSSSSGGTAGAGGASGSSSSGGGMGGAGGGGPTYSWTATDPAAAGGAGTSACKLHAYALPPWLVFESPAAVRSSQLSEESLCIGYNANDARARNVGPANNPKWGLSIESERANIVLQSKSWTGGGAWMTPGGANAMMPVPNQADPAGGSAATQFDNDSMSNPAGQQSPYQVVTKARTLSTWAKGIGAAAAGCKKFEGGNESCYARFRHLTTGGSAYVNITGTAWKRFDFSHTADETDSMVLDTKDQPAGAGVISGITSFLAFGAQAEKGNYPSSYIPTTNAMVTRATETLYIPGANAPDVLKNGFFEVIIRFAPNFAHDEISTDYHLFQIHDGEAWRVYLDASTKKITVKFNNVTDTVVSNSLEFPRETEIEIKVSNLEGSTVKLEVKGPPVGGGIFDDGKAVAAAPTNKNIFILSHHDGAEECGDLRYFEIR